MKRATDGFFFFFTHNHTVVYRRTGIFGQSATRASSLSRTAETIKNTAMRRNTKLGAELRASICSLMRIGGSVGGGDAVFLKAPFILYALKQSRVAFNSSGASPEAGQKVRFN